MFIIIQVFAMTITRLVDISSSQDISYSNVFLKRFDVATSWASGIPMKIWRNNMP